MTISMSQFVEGAAKFVDVEMLPALPAGQRWAAAAVFFVLKERLPGILTSVPFIKTLGLIDSSNNIDIDTARNAVKQACQTHGKMEITIPMLGVFSFDEKAFDKLYKTIMAEVTEPEPENNTEDD